MTDIGWQASLRGAGLRPLLREVVSRGHMPLELPSQEPRLTRGDTADTAYHYTLVRRLVPAVAGAVVRDEGLRTRGGGTDAEGGDIVIPDDPFAFRGGE